MNVSTVLLCFVKTIFWNVLAVVAFFNFIWDNYTQCIKAPIFVKYVVNNIKINYGACTFYSRRVIKNYCYQLRTRFWHITKTEKAEHECFSHFLPLTLEQYCSEFTGCLILIQTDYMKKQKKQNVSATFIHFVRVSCSAGGREYRRLTVTISRIIT